MSANLDEIKNGTLGHFWTTTDTVGNLDSAESGHVRLLEDGHFWIEFLTTRRALDKWARPHNAPSSSAESLYARHTPRVIYS